VWVGCWEMTFNFRGKKNNTRESKKHKKANGSGQKSNPTPQNPPPRDTPDQANPPDPPPGGGGGGFLDQGGVCFGLNQKVVSPKGGGWDTR